MPFVKPANRDLIRKQGPSACQDVGDICFVFYSQIMDIWRKEPRWRTAQRIYRQFSLEVEDSEFFHLIYDTLGDKFECYDVIAASQLAYQVFFNKYVMDYETEKEKLNGEI